MENQHQELTQKYSTWGNKLLQHTDRLAEIQNDRKFRPITVQLCPTEVCDSDCPFCSVAGRPIKSRMAWETVVQVLTDFATLGAKALEITGGGNPMLYSHSGHDINDIVILADSLGMDVGIITNSHNLKRLRPEVHPMLNWVRISLIQLHEGRAPEDYDFAGYPEDKMGFSYIIYDGRNGPDEMSRTGKTYEGTTVETIQQIAHLVELHPQVKFVRMAGDCLVQGDNVRVARNWRPVIEEIDRWGKFFLKDIGDQDVPFDDACYVGLLRPYVACHPEGDSHPYQVYICSSYVLTTRTYDTEYSMGDVADIIPAWGRMNAQYRETGTPYEIKGNGGTGWCATCEHCFYANNNHLIHTVVTELPDKNFA